MAKVSMCDWETHRLSYRSKQWDEIDPRAGLTLLPLKRLAILRHCAGLEGLSATADSLLVSRYNDGMIGERRHSIDKLQPGSAVMQKRQERSV